MTRDELIAVKKGTILHENGCTKARVVRWKVNGACKTWKSRPDDFSLPVKHGMYVYSHITPENAHLVHLASECPVPDHVE